MTDQTVRDGVVETPTAVSESSFQIGGLTMRVYHLSDGRQLINADDVAAFFSGAIDQAFARARSLFAKLEVRG